MMRLLSLFVTNLFLQTPMWNQRWNHLLSLRTVVSFSLSFLQQLWSTARAVNPPIASFLVYAQPDRVHRQSVIFFCSKTPGQWNVLILCVFEAILTLQPHMNFPDRFSLAPLLRSVFPLFGYPCLQGNTQRHRCFLVSRSNLWGQTERRGQV